MSKPKPVEEKRVPLNCLIGPGTRAAMIKIRNTSGESHGEIVDRAVAALEMQIAQGRIDVRPRKVTKKEKHVAELKASDPLAEIMERDDIEHGNMDLPSSGSIALDALENKVESDVNIARQDFNRPPHVAPVDWRAGRKPIPKPGDRK